VNQSYNAIKYIEKPVPEAVHLAYQKIRGEK
jgi:hypothetical protein